MKCLVYSPEEKAKSKEIKLEINYLSNWSEDTSTGGFIHINKGTGNQADQAHSHGCSWDSETDIHPRMRLDPDKNCECNKLPHTEGEVGGIEVRGELLGLLGVLLSELVRPMRDYVGFQAPTS